MVSMCCPIRIDLADLGRPCMPVNDAQQPMLDLGTHWLNCRDKFVCFHVSEFT